MTWTGAPLLQLAHQGGWDELTAAVLGPLLVVGVLVAVAVRGRPDDEDDEDDEGEGETVHHPYRQSQ